MCATLDTVLCSRPCCGLQPCAVLRFAALCHAVLCWPLQGCDRLLECGTTCTLALVQGDQLCVANVGDSSAALVSLTNDGDVAARLLTVDHNGMYDEEAARIRSQYSGVAW